MNKKPVIRVTMIEAFRRYLEQSEYANYEITEQSVIDSVTGAFKGSVYTRIGTAVHRIIEEGKPVCKKVSEGVRNFTFKGKPVTEPVPCGRSFEVEGNDVVLDIMQIKTALAYREAYPNAFHEFREYKDYGDCVVTGCADVINGTEIRDIKNKFSQNFSDQDYIDSCQWRFYMELFGLDTFHFDLFVFDGYDADKHGYDVRGLPLHRYDPITCYNYSLLEQDNRRLLSEFLLWAKTRELTQYLTFKEE